jgi:hypothetical protein
MRCRVWWCGVIAAAARGLVGGGLIVADPCHTRELKPTKLLCSQFSSAATAHQYQFSGNQFSSAQLPVPAAATTSLTDGLQEGHFFCLGCCKAAAPR